MNLLQLRTAFRVDTDDMVPNPYLFSDEQFLEWINDAQEEACIRANLIFESTNESMCQVTVTPDERSYSLDDKWHCITKAYFASECGQLALTSREDLDRRRPRWRQETESPRELMVFDGRVELDTAVRAEQILYLEGFRLPGSQLKSDGSKPEITRTHHRYLIEWAKYRAYSRPDSETFNADKAGQAVRQFTAYFGPRPDATLRREQHADTPHRNVGFWV